MEKKTLYLETSIFGFYYDEELVNLEKREAVRTLLEQTREGVFDGIVSQFVVLELQRARDVDFLKILRENKIEVIKIDEEEVGYLTNKYIKAGVLPETLLPDARHVACATILDVDILVSLNLRHIVNTWRIKKFNGVNLTMGYKVLEILTPGEVIFYED